MAAPRFEVVWADAALADVTEILEFIETEGPGNPGALLDRIAGAVESLDRHPQRGREVPELAERGIHSFRQILLSPWRIVYTIRGLKVQVLLVVDSRRNLEQVLVERILRKR